MKAVVEELAAMYGVVAPPSLTALEWILLENASYLVDDDRRWQVFEKLRDDRGQRGHVMTKNRLGGHADLRESRPSP